MKAVITILLFFLAIPYAYGQDNNKLYPVNEGNLWGYINRSGRMVIEPQFFSAGEFAEGLAPVRMNGTYGYINEQGEFVILPEYDLALPFQDGIAKIYIDGKPFFIDKKGKIIFDHVYKTITVFGNDPVAIVTTITGKYGLIDRNGKLFADTIFSKIQPFADGLAIVTGLNHYPYRKDKEPVFEMGAIDMKGSWVIKYGRYKRIENYKNGYAKVELILTEDEGKDWADREAVVDTKGQQRFIFPATKFQFDYGKEGFYNDVAVVRIYSVDVKTKKIWSSSERTDFMGVIDTEGRVLFSDPSWKELTPFSHNRAFAQDMNGNWKMIDKGGKQVTDLAFEEILYDTYSEDPANLFAGGYAFVKYNDSWKRIDTSGRLDDINPDPEDKADFDDMIRHGEMVILQEDVSTEHRGYSYAFGFWNTRNNRIVKCYYSYIDTDTDNELLLAVKDASKMCYLDRSGNIIWSEESGNEIGDRQLNIDHMNRGYFYASSVYKKELAGYGGWGSSSNGSKPVLPWMKQNSSNGLQVIIDESANTRWMDEYEGMKLYVINGLKDTLFFEAQDSRLYLNLQAKDKNGEWKDIEYLPGSWCGNSYHQLFLSHSEYWEFSIPVYHGEFKTKIRAKLLYKKEQGQKESTVFYSNEINGYINPGQFWNKRKYYPGGIMDPYND